MQIYVRTRGQARALDYQFLGETPEDFWWRSYRSVTDIERPTILARSNGTSWQAYLAGITSQRLDSTKIPIQINLALSGECGAGVDNELALAIITRSAVGLAEQGGEFIPGDLLDRTLPGDVVERMLTSPGRATADAAADAVCAAYAVRPDAPDALSGADGAGRAEAGDDAGSADAGDGAGSADAGDGAGSADAAMSGRSDQGSARPELLLSASTATGSAGSPIRRASGRSRRSRPGCCSAMPSAARWCSTWWRRTRTWTSCRTGAARSARSRPGPARAWTWRCGSGEKPDLPQRGRNWNGRDPGGISQQKDDAAPGGGGGGGGGAGGADRVAGRGGLSGHRTLGKELRIIVVDADSERKTRYSFPAEWRAEGARRTLGVVRAAVGHGESGGVIGTVTVDWQSFSDNLGRIPFVGDLLAAGTRKVSEQVGNPDPANALSEISIEIDGALKGRSISVRATKAESYPNYWILPGRPKTDWWKEIVVYRDGVATPAEIDRE